MKRLAIALTLALAAAMLLLGYRAKQPAVVTAPPTPSAPPTTATFHCEVGPSGNAETGLCVGPAPACARIRSLNCVSGTPVDPTKNVRTCGGIYNSAKVCLGR
jgi:hypothetical protein